MSDVTETGMTAFQLSVQPVKHEVALFLNERRAPIAEFFLIKPDKAPAG